LNVTRKTTHLLCTKDELDKLSSRVLLAVKYNVPIVAEAWVTDSVSDDIRRDESNYLLKLADGQNRALQQKFKESERLREKEKIDKPVDLAIFGDIAAPFIHANVSPPTKEEDYDIFSNNTNNNNNNNNNNQDAPTNGTSSPSPSSPPNSTVEQQQPLPSATPSSHKTPTHKTPTTQKTPTHKTPTQKTPDSHRSKRQRVAKDFGDDIEVSRPRKKSPQPRKKKEPTQENNNETEADTTTTETEPKAERDGNGDAELNDNATIKTLLKEIRHLKREIQSLRTDVTEVLRKVSKKKLQHPSR